MAVYQEAKRLLKSLDFVPKHLGTPIADAFKEQEDCFKETQAKLQKLEGILSRIVDIYAPGGNPLLDSTIAEAREMLPQGLPKPLPDLLRCPSCGGSNVELITGKDPETGRSRFDRVRCKFCGVTGPWFDGHPLDAVNGWNNLPRNKEPEELDEIHLPFGLYPGRNG